MGKCTAIMKAIIGTLCIIFILEAVAASPSATNELEIDRLKAPPLGKPLKAPQLGKPLPSIEARRLPHLTSVSSKQSTKPRTIVKSIMKRKKHVRRALKKRL